MSEDALGIVIHHVAAVQLVNSIVAQARPLTNGERARFVANQAQRKIQALAVPGVAVIRYSHGWLPLMQFGGFRIKNKLTEINHKVSVVAKWFRRVIAGVFAAKCAGYRANAKKIGICREAAMQDAIVGSWAQESHLSAEALGSLRDLNHRFL